MYKINEKKKKAAGKEILGHAFKSCLTKRKKFLSENGNNFSVQFCMPLVLFGHNICISGANDSVIEEGLILGPMKCRYIEWCGILPNTSNPRFV